MRDVLSTIAADQDAIIRADSLGTLVVDGGPGTGKTVVALHRAAYLFYSDPRLSRGRLLIVGPHDAYLACVADVLPSLGEEGVQTCTLRDLVAEGGLAHAASSAIPEDDEGSTLSPRRDSSSIWSSWSSRRLSATGSPESSTVESGHDANPAAVTAEQAADT